MRTQFKYLAKKVCIVITISNKKILCRDVSSINDFVYMFCSIDEIYYLKANGSFLVIPYIF